MKIWIFFSVLFFCPLMVMANLVVDEIAPGNEDVPLFDSKTITTIDCNSHDARVETIAVGFLSDDFERVSGRRPNSGVGSTAILIGTVGQSAVIDHLIASGKIDVTGVKGQ